MASVIRKEHRDGSAYYELRASKGRGSTVTKRYTPPEGVSRKTADRLAQKEAFAFEREVKAGQVLTKKEKAAQAAAEAAERAKILTVKQFAESVYMPTKESNLAENSRSSYQGFLDNWILPALGEYKLTEVTPAMVSALLLDMQQQGKAVATRTKVYNILNGLFEMAFLQDAIPVNPMLKVQRPKARKDEQASTEPETLTAEQVQQLLAFMEGEPLQWRVFVHVLLDTGIRRGEACALQWANIDFQGGAVLIDKTLNYTPAKGVYQGTPKNGKRRVVYVGGKTLSLLRQLREEQAGRCVSQWCFTQQDSPEPMHPQSPTRYFKKLSGRCGIALHPHMTRHTFASLALTNGGDVVSVSQVLGHSDTSVTLRVYAHASEESARKAAAAFREAIGEN